MTAQVAQAKKATFLTSFAEVGTVTHAARAADVPRRTVYNWLERDADFRARFAEAEQEAIDSLEKAAIQRARDGVTEPIVSAKTGEVVGYTTKYSDTLLIFLLKGGRPSKYRERVDVTFQAREVAERLANELGGGVTAEDIMAEAERIAGRSLP